MEKLHEIKGEGWVSKELPYGCNLCEKGLKMVYFMGGDCLRPERCSWYCPISKERKNPNAHFADEIPIKNPNSLKHVVSKLKYESEKIGAMGMSITGGDPLSTSRKVNWTCSIISSMKIEMGEQFHIHLYTCGSTFDNITANKLERAGLDSIRFHPHPDDFFRIHYALERNFTVGAEVPVIPTEENHQYLMDLGGFLDSVGANYLNLNEFEMVEPNSKNLQERGFELKKESLATVSDSREYAKKFAREFLSEHDLNVHFCTAKFKDSVQIRSRYLRRAHNIQRSLEEVTEDGTLMFFRLKGSAHAVKELYEHLVQTSGMPEKLLDLKINRGWLDLPPFLSQERDFLQLLEDFRVEGGVYEILPFREKEGTYQIVEYTPLESKD